MSASQPAALQVAFKGKSTLLRHLVKVGKGRSNVKLCCGNHSMGAEIVLLQQASKNVDLLCFLSLSDDLKRNLCSSLTNDADWLAIDPAFRSS